jgi:hypothetical protein
VRIAAPQAAVPPPDAGSDRQAEADHRANQGAHQSADRQADHRTDEGADDGADRSTDISTDDAAHAAEFTYGGADDPADDGRPYFISYCADCDAYTKHRCYRDPASPSHRDRVAHQHHADADFVPCRLCDAAAPSAWLVGTLAGGGDLYACASCYRTFTEPPGR